MINIKGQLSKKERQQVDSLLEEFSDLYGDFYITKDNLRLFIKENKHLFFECLKKGDKVIWDDEKGIIFITGYSDKAPRKYIKILTNNEELVGKLLKVLLWQTDCDLYAKVKKNNPIRRILQNNGFRFCGDRGKEILLCRKHIPQTESYIKEE